MMNNPWEEIERPKGELHYRLIDPDHPLRLLRARDSSDRFLFIYEFQSSAKVTDTFPNLNGIDIFLNTPTTSVGNCRLILILRDKEDWQIFWSLCGDILASTRGLECGREATLVILRRLKKWQEFLKRSRKDLLSENLIKGLLGELIFIQNHLFKSFGSSESIQFWQGPDDLPQDFNVNDSAIEVKCQSGVSTPKVRISSINQLCPQLPSMYLYVVTLGKSEKQHPEAFNLPLVVSQIRDVLMVKAPSEYERFNDLLYQVGYLDLNAYEEYNYILVAEKMYEVTEGFPRICPLSVPEGVTDLRYSISLIDCEQFEAYPEWMNIT